MTPPSEASSRPLPWLVAVLVLTMAIATLAATTTAAQTPPPDLAVTISATPEPVLRGGTIIYAVAVTNNAATAATSVVLTAALPSSLTSVSAPSCASGRGGLTCSLDTIAAGATVERTLRGTAVTRAGAITAGVSVRGVIAGANVTAAASATSTLVVPTPTSPATRTPVTRTPVTPALALTIAETPDPVVRGDRLTYTPSR